MRVIIIAAGEATRWGNYLGVPKHLLNVDGENLLQRSTRLFRTHGAEDVFIVHRGTDTRYETAGASTFVPQLNYEQNADADKFLSSESLWDTDGRTVVVYGDCWLSDEAVDTIASFQGKDFTLFARSQASDLTGTPWGECFAFSFYPAQHARLRETLHRIARLRLTDVISRCGGWELYRAWTGVPDTQLVTHHCITTNFVEIDDWSDDFDFPEDWDRWSQRRDAHLAEN